MLKLMKFEFKQYALSYLMIFLGFLVLSFTVPIVHRTSSMVHLNFLIQTLFVLLAAAIAVGVFINAARTWIDSMFHRPAYLTLTLPVNTHQLILSKLIPSVFWVLVSLFVVVLGVFFLVLTSFEPGIDILISTGSDAFHALCTIMTNYPLEAISYVLSALGALTNILLTLYMCFTITHTSWIRKHRILSAIVLFLVIQIILGNVTINSVSYSITGLLQEFIIYDYPSTFSTFSKQMTMSALFQWIQCLIPYFITWFCLEKKLEIQ